MCASVDRITASKGCFSDGQGRQRLFNGLNLVCKSSDSGYVYPLAPDDYRQLAHSGINLLRFGVFWAAVEPEPGVFDGAYLQRVKEQLEYAHQAGLSFFLDFHQDLYGVSFGPGEPAWADGAPVWAAVTDGLPHVTGDLWSDAYLISPALNRAFQHFWNNDPVCGLGLQEHFVEMLRHTVRFFKGMPGLLGYDLWNEPYPGPAGQEALGRVMEQLPGPANLEQDGEKARLIAGLTDMDFYRGLTEIIARHTMPFEQERLTAFYERAARAVSGEDPQALLFTEPCYFTNLGAPSGLGKLSVPGQVFAPHGYDLIVDTGHDDLFDPRRVELIFQRHKETGERLGVPTIVGEWGAFGGRPGNEAAGAQMMDIIERNLWSHTYWCWEEDIVSHPEWRQLVRAYPAAVAGRLRSYHWDGGAFTMEYDAVPGTTEIFIPGLAAHEWRTDFMQGDGTVEAERWEDTGHGVLLVTADRAQRVRLRVESIP